MFPKVLKKKGSSIRACVSLYKDVCDFSKLETKFCLKMVKSNSLMIITQKIKMHPEITF